MNTGSQLTGEKIPGDLSSWAAHGTDPNLLTADTYDLLSKRSMTLYHTGGIPAGAINKNVEYAIGQGLMFRSRPDHEVLGISPNKARKWGLKFQKLLHYFYSDINFYSKQSVAMRTALAMGDSLLFFDRDKNVRGKFDLIETGGDQIDPEFKKKNYTLGIKHDALLRREGIAKRDGKEIAFVDENGDQNVIQYYNKEMARQLRGWPGWDRVGHSWLWTFVKRSQLSAL